MKHSAQVFAESGAGIRVGAEGARRADTVRVVAIAGIIVTFAVTGVLGVLSSIVAVLPIIVDATGMELRLSSAIRVAVAAGLLWCPLVAAKAVSPYAGLVQHVHFTFGAYRTIWGLTLLGAMAVATIAAEITGSYGWFLLAVLLALAWGFRTGVILNQLRDPSASTEREARRTEARARAAALTGRLRSLARRS